MYVPVFTKKYFYQLKYIFQLNILFVLSLQVFLCVELCFLDLTSYPHCRSWSEAFVVKKPYKVRRKIGPTVGHYLYNSLSLSFSLSHYTVCVRFCLSCCLLNNFNVDERIRLSLWGLGSSSYRPPKYLLLIIQRGLGKNVAGQKS